MTGNIDLESILVQSIEIHRQNKLPNRNYIHLLAHNRYEPAKQFFVQCLDDKNEDWRYECLSALGFHFVLDDILMEKVRHLSLHDESSLVRMCANSVWFAQKQTIDHHLLSVLDNDEDSMVKESILSHILTKYIKQIHPLTIRDVKEKVKNGEVALNSVGIGAFLAKFNIKLT